MNTDTTSIETPPRRRSASREQVDRLLAERQQMLVQMCDLNTMLGTGTGPGVGLKLQDFCQILMDYIAAGHFGLYQRIVSGTERRQGVIRLGAELYPEIEQATRVALDFNEHYQGTSEPGDTEALTRELSQLGEALAARIELEDELIAAMGLRARA